jgi:hypothetical protein
MKGKFAAFWGEINKTNMTKEEYDQFVRTLGIEGAGPIPESLLARQDLECEDCGTCELCMSQKAEDGADKLPKCSICGRRATRMDYHMREEHPAKKSLTQIDSKTIKSMKLEVHKNLKVTTSVIKNAFEECDVPDFNVAETYNDVQILIGPDMADMDGHSIGSYVVVGVDGNLQVFFTMEAAHEYIDSVLKAISDAMHSSYGKGAVETTGKELIDMAMEAKHADVPTDSLVDNIKAIQLRRQKATLKEREKEETSKSFKEGWEALSKKGRSN